MSAPKPAGAPTALPSASRERLKALGQLPRFGRVPLKPLGEVALSDEEQQKLNDLYGRAHDEAARLKANPGPGSGAAQRAAWLRWSEEAEEFVADHPESAWTPGVSLQLGGAHLARLNYSGAVASLRRAHQLTRDRAEPRAREIAADAARQLAGLLAVSGQMAEFDELVAEELAKDPHRVAATWFQARELRSWIGRYPGEAYKCGLQCLDQLAKLTQPDQYPPQVVLMQPADPLGYDARTLLKVGRQAGLPVPAVLHLKFGHYVAVRQRDGDFYEVLDPATAGPVWLTAAELATDASGLLIVSTRSSTAGVGPLRPVSDAEAAQYRGRCYHGTPFDKNSPPPPACGGGGAGGGGQAGSKDFGQSAPADALKPDPEDEPKHCRECTQKRGTIGGSRGMPVWWIDEPYLNLWVQDTPLTYHPKYGPDVDFTLTFQSRSDSGVGEYPANLVRGDYNNHWSCSWFGWIHYDDASGNQAQVYLPGGGQSPFTFTGGSTNSAADYWTHASLQKRAVGTNVTGFWLLQPDGGRLEFMSASPNNASGGTINTFYMTAQRDPQGLATVFEYDAETRNLTNVVAADGVSFQVLNAATTGSIGMVTNSLGLNLLLGYNETNAAPDGTYISQALSSITDTAGIKSYLKVSTAAANYIRTPYGLTTIVIEGMLGSSDFTPDTVERYVQISHPDGTTEAYATMSEYAATDWPTWSGGQIPDTSAAFVSRLDTQERKSRNTFHWSPQARAIMTKDFAAIPPPTLNWSDIKLARIRHWLTHTENTYTHWGTVSWEQSPSPDNSTEGAVLWYDYVGKPAFENDNRGTESQPAVLARVMPDGTVWWQSTTRNSLGNPLSQIERWWQNGAYTTRTTTFTWTADAIDLVSHTGPDSVLRQGYGYDGSRRVTSTTNGVAEVTTYAYDGNNRLTAQKWASGHALTNVYSGDGLTATQTGYLGATPYRTNVTVRTSGVTYARSGLNGTTLTNATTWFKVTDERGLVVTNIYDSLDRLWERRQPNGLTEWRHYELFPNQSYPTGAGGKRLLDLTAVVAVAGGTNYSTNTNTYDNRRRLGYAGDPRTNLTAYSYCDCGALSQVVRGYGQALAETTTHSHDLQGNRTKSVFADGSAVTNIFDGLGRRVQVWDALGKTTNGFDNAGRLITSSNAFGQLAKSIFDVNDRLASLTDRNGVTVTNTYDNVGRLRTRKNAGDNGTESFGYTANYGAATSFTNQVGNVTTWAYNAAQRKTAEVVVGVMTNSFTYAPAGDLLTLSDGKSQVTTWGYDNLGRVVSKKYANGVTNLTYGYDVLSRLTNRWSQAKGNTAHSYDRSGNLTNVNYPASTDLAFQYDALNRATNLVDAAGTTKYSYAGGLLTSEDGPWASDTVSYSYNGTRQRKQAVVIQPAGNAWTNTYAYDAARRLTNVTSPAGVFGYVYKAASPASLVGRLSLPGGPYITNSFDANGRIADSTLNTSGGSALNRHGYLVNLANQRHRLSRTNSANAGWAGYWTNTYDAAGELRTLRGYNGSGTAVPADNFDYGYDAAWNLANRTNNGTVTFYTVNNLNQVTSDGTAHTYDNNGNRANGPASPTAATYEYDDENQLTAVYVPGYWKQSYTYDGRQRARVRLDYTWSGAAWVLSTETRYVYDGMELVQERTSANNPAVTYTRGQDLSGSLAGTGGIGGLLARSAHQSTTPYQLSTSANYHADGNGNVTALVDSAGALQANYRYDAYGRTLASSGTLAAANLMRFSSKPLWAPNAGGGGLYYYGYRFYDPTAAKWVNRDPIGELGGLNLYHFNFNDPIVRMDTDGLGSITSPAAVEIALELEAAELGITVAELLARKAAEKAAETMAKQLAKDGAKSVAKACRKFGKRIEEHLAEIAKNPKSRDVKHWKDEIRNWERLKNAGEELLKKTTPPTPPVPPVAPSIK